LLRIHRIRKYQAAINAPAKGMIPQKLVPMARLAGFAVDVVDPLRVRFTLDRPWPDFLLFYATPATGAAWIVPKKYIEKVGEEGFKKAPVGAGPYKVVSVSAGNELRLEAFADYWRKKPAVKNIIMRSIPDESTRAVAVKTGEIDLAYLFGGPVAQDLKRSPGITIKAPLLYGMYWLDFLDQWDPKSPWHDKRLRLAVNHALNRKAISEAACLGFCPPAAVIVPRVMDYALQVEPPAYDPQKARQLLAEAGYPRGFDAGEFVPIPPFFTAAEGVINDLKAVGIRVKMRLVERATFYAEWREKKLRGIFLTAVGNSGNAASRVEAFIYSKGSYSYGGYPDIDELFLQQARERDSAKREAVLHRIQQLAIDRAMFAPLMDLRALTGIGPRMAEHTINLVPMSAFPSYEDMRLK